jgi:hypothetical protein
MKKGKSILKNWLPNLLKLKITKATKNQLMTNGKKVIYLKC